MTTMASKLDVVNDDAYEYPGKGLLDRVDGWEYNDPHEQVTEAVAWDY